MPSQELTEQDDERSPLIRQSRHPTPLPAGQLFALLLLMIAEPVMAFSVLPYINEVCLSFLVWHQAQPVPDIQVMMPWDGLVGWSTPNYRW